MSVSLDREQSDTHALPRKVAQLIATAGVACAGVGSLGFVIGSLAVRSQASVALVSLGYTLPSCVLLAYASRCIGKSKYVRAAIVSIIGGAFGAVDVLMAALSAAYANPCFEVGNCTRGPSFAYVVFTAVMFAFVVVAATGIVISPIATGVAGWQRRSVEKNLRIAHPQS